MKLPCPVESEQLLKLSGPHKKRRTFYSANSSRTTKQSRATTKERIIQELAQKEHDGYEHGWIIHVIKHDDDDGTNTDFYCVRALLV